MKLSYYRINKTLFLALIAVMVCALAAIAVLYINQKIQIGETLQITCAVLSLVVSILSLGVSMISLFRRNRKYKRKSTNK